MEVATSVTATMMRRIFIGPGGWDLGVRPQVSRSSPGGSRVWVWRRLAAYDEDDKAARQDWRTGGRIVGRWVGTGTEFSRDKIGTVGCGVVGHGAGAALGRQILDCGVRCGAGVDDGESAGTAARGEGKFVDGVPASSVRAIADDGIRQRLAGVGVDNGHALAVAD